MRGLVADDEEGIRNVIREYLEFDGHTVAEAANGAEAVSLCRMQKFDFIVMDIMMPVMDGFAACREIRRGDPSVPVLMLSARGEEYDKLKGFQLGIDDYVVKPFSPRELVARLGAICARSARAQDGGAGRPAAFGGLEVDPAGRSVRVLPTGPPGFQLPSRQLLSGRQHPHSLPPLPPKKSSPAPVRRRAVIQTGNGTPGPADLLPHI